MDNQLLMLFVWNSLTHLCLSAIIPTTTVTTPGCPPDGILVQDCRVFLCEDGSWQPFEFTHTLECCMKTFYPACESWGITPPEQAPTSSTCTDEKFIRIRKQLFHKRLAVQGFDALLTQHD